MQRIQNRNKHQYIIVSIIMLVIFILYNIGLNTVIHNHYYKMKKDESQQLSATYALTISKVNASNEIADDLLNERIVVALDVISEYENVYSNEILADLAKLLKLDEIYIYDTNAIIVHSASLSYLGWQAYEGHPVYEFWQSNFSRHIEDIRKDSNSENHYKYGYVKLRSGYFIQIAIAAERIYEYVETIQIPSILSDLKDSGAFEELYFISNDYEVITSDQTQIDETYLDDNFISKIMKQREFEHSIKIDNRRVYENFVHVMDGSRRIGVLGLRYDLEETEQIILSVFLVTAIPLGFIYLLLSYLILLKIKSDRKLLSLAYQDPITGLNNRTYLKEMLNGEIVKNKHVTQAIILINCSNFKFINQSYGFEIGDSILHEIGRRIFEAKISEDIYRFTADRFVVYLSHYKSQTDLIRQINSINELFSKPFVLAKTKQYLNIQLGVVEIDETYQSLDEILKDATFAIDHIKQSDQKNYIFFNESMNTKQIREEIILKEIHGALESSNFDTIYNQFQPILSLKQDKIVSFEALARMKSESLGLIQPVEFIDIAERNQLIVSLGKHVLHNVCRFLKNIHQHGFDDVRASINVSVIELFREDFVKGILETLNKQNIDPSFITLEITESILFHDFDIVNRKLRQLQAYGITIALDDFGMGYSSFNRLDALNIDILKIDKYFIDKIQRKRPKNVIVSDVISMAHKFDLEVVAEGVDQFDQHKYLKDNDCDMIQGYLFSKPLSEDDALLMLFNWERINKQKN